MQFLCKIFVGWLIKCNAIENEDRELYEYAVNVLILTIAPLVLVMVIGLVTGWLYNGILLILPFLIMRKFSGGFHARYASVCFILSVAVLIICMYLTTVAVLDIRLNLCTVAALVSLAWNSPVDSQNRRLDQTEHVRYKHIMVGLAFAFGLLYFVLVILKYTQCAVCISTGIILTAFLQFLGVIKNAYGLRGSSR